MAGQGASPLGHGVGGGAQHYGAHHGRYAPWSYTPYSSTVSRYGASFLSNIEPNVDLIDFPVTYDQMVPLLRRVRAGVRRHGNEPEPVHTHVLELPAAPSSSHSPGDDVPDGDRGARLQSVSDAQWHRVPTLHEPVRGAGKRMRVRRLVQRRRRMRVQCETGAKANSAYRTIPAAIKSGNFTMALDSYIFRLDPNSSGQITDVRYYDAQGNVHVQPATAFFQGLWGWNNTRIPLLSGVGANHTIPRRSRGRSEGECLPPPAPVPLRAYRACSTSARTPIPPATARARLRDPRLGRRQLRPHGAELHRRGPPLSRGLRRGRPEQPRDSEQLLCREHRQRIQGFREELLPAHEDHADD